MRVGINTIKNNSWESTLVVFYLFAMIISSFLSPYYLNIGQILYSIEQTMAVSASLALGFMFLILVGEIDISLPGILALGTVLFGKLASIGLPISVSIIIVFLICTLAGAFNGWLIVKFSLPSMAVTLGMMGIYRAIALWIGGVQGFSRKIFPSSYFFIGNKMIFSLIPLSIIILTVLFLIAYVVIHRSVFGRLLFAVGNNRRATYFSGHSVKKIVIGSYSIAGLMAGVAALLFINQYQSARSDNASNTLLFVVACIALGGFDLAGGKGKVFGLIISILLLGTIQNGMGLANIQGSVQTLVIGFILILSIIIPAIIKKIQTYLYERSKRIINATNTI